MGSLKEDVKNLHLRLFSGEAALLKPFLFNFDVNFAKRVDVSNTQISAYIISPDRLMREGFAFTEELLLIISMFNKMQPRTMQAIDYIMNMRPFKGRVDPLTYFIVSADDMVEEWVSEHIALHPQARTPIPISVNALRIQRDDRWLIRNELSSRLYSRDIFDYQLPLDGDLFFFGRKGMIDIFLDSIRKSQNQGLFGLRKTGKTSFLFKIVRACSELNIANTFYVDCKRPNIRGLGWQGLITYVNERISTNINKTFARTADPINNLVLLLNSFPDNERVCLIFDEIEYISPLAHLDEHWKSDFVPFWQTLWSVQSEFRKLSFVIAGVNPYVCEVDLIDRTQNPMFGIVRPHFLGGLNSEEVSQMVKAIGGRMGLGFEPDALAYLHLRYGGHPLLTRLACSFTNRSLDQQSVQRPISITAKMLANEEGRREDELYFYCRHVVSELQDFYPDEYEMLELLASGNIVDFNELAAEPGWTNHLKSYGIISILQSGKPSFRIPVLQRFVASERARRVKDKQLRTFVKPEFRSEWLSHRKQNVLRDLKLLLKTIKSRGMWEPYGQAILPEADLLQGAKLASDWGSFNFFITEINKCLNESIEKAHDKTAFFGPFKQHYTDLFDAFHRIRLYRNNADHLRLNAHVEEAFRQYLDKDLYGRNLSSIDEPWFALQQVVMDELFSSIQYELAKLT